MEEPRDTFLYFSVQTDGSVELKENDFKTEFILPRHPETNELDIYYLQSMLKFFDPAKNISESEILDAFPVIALTKNKKNKFYKLSLYRLYEFYKNEVEEDEYIQASMKHVFMYSLLATPTNKTKKVIKGCLDKVTPVMYRREQADTVDCDSYDLQCLASYVPTSRYRIMKLLKGWIEGALHFYDYSIMFFENRCVGFDDFNENIIDLTTEDIFLKHDRQDIAKVMISSSGIVTLNESELYYAMPLDIITFKGQRLFTSPNNDNERDGKVMMFRNKDLQGRLEDILASLFPRDSFRVNDVFKWNRYNNGGKFNSHYDTMFVKTSSEECSLYTLLIYLEVKGDTFMYLTGKKEIQVRIERRTAYIIPHWVKHRVEGHDAREFIKTEIIFNNVGTTYDKSLADAFDESCYYMLQSVRHPELKDIVSKNFNTINEARFYKTTFVPKLINNIYFEKTICKLPFEYYQKCSGNLVKTYKIQFNFITDGIFYYFKIKNDCDGPKSVVSRNELVFILSVMQLDIQPKKMFERNGRDCQCTSSSPDPVYYYRYSNYDIGESISYWKANERDGKIDNALHSIQLPSDMENIYRVGNISLSDIPENPKSYYFAACLCPSYNQSLITEMVSKDCDGKYTSLNVDFIGNQKNILKIRQLSFKNGVVVTRRWVTDTE